MKKNNSSHQVCLKDNNFYDDKCININSLYPKDLIDYFNYSIDYELSFKQMDNFAYIYRIELENIIKNEKKNIYISDNIKETINKFNIKYNYKFYPDNYKINMYIKVTSENKSFEKEERIFSSLYIKNEKDSTTSVEEIY